MAWVQLPSLLCVEEVFLHFHLPTDVGLLRQSRLKFAAAGNIEKIWLQLTEEDFKLIILQ